MAAAVWCLGRIFVLAFALAGLCLAAPVLAQAVAPGTLSLTVSPLVVEFHAGAGETGTARISVHNNGSDPERIVAQRMDWRTAADGAVRVEFVGTEGGASISNALRIAPEDVVLAPGETRVLALTLDVPGSFSSATAVYRGGFLLRALPTSGAASFIPGATVVVYNTVGAPRAHVQLTQLRVRPNANGTAELAARIVNDGVAYARTSGHVVVTREGRIVADTTENIPVLFAGDARVFTKALRDLPAGAYQLAFTLDYGGSTLIEGTTAFRIP